jgi:predicted outer membrane repeat protein
VAGDCCGGADCVDPNKPICAQNMCSACTSTSQCPASQICGGGPCLECDVCADGCDFDSVQDAIDAAGSGVTIAICPGTYLNAKGRVVVSDLDPDRMVTLMGAGDGAGPANNTILQNTEPNNRVVQNAAKLKLQNLRVTGGSFMFGAGISSWGTLTVVGCTIVENDTPGGGGGIYTAGTMHMIDSTVTENKAAAGGGISTEVGSTSTFTNCDITGNDATSTGGGIQTSGAVTFQVATTRVTGNTAGHSGGGIYVDGDAADLNGIAFVDISGNTPASSQCVGQGCPA